jgi:hypothetical protein
MATPAFGPARVAALKENEQSGKLLLLKQWVDNPQFFCCISGTAVGVLKDPVCILEVDDRVYCTDEDVVLDFSRSWSPTDSLAGTAYTIHWGDGSTTNGNFPDPRNPAAEVETYVGGYDTEGFYDITMDIVDTLGATAVGRIQVYAEVCPPAPLIGPLPGEAIEGDAVLVGSRGFIIPYTTTWTSSPPTWNYTSPNYSPYMSNPCTMYVSGPGANRLFGCAISYIQNEWTGSDGVIAEYTPLPMGTGAWTAKVTALQIATALGHAADYYGVTLSRMIFGLTEAQEGWAWAVGICYYNGGGGASDRYALHFCVHTRDAWSTIHSCAEIDTHSYGGFSIHLYSNIQVGIAQDLHTGYLFVALAERQVGPAYDLDLWRSQDNGASWVLADEDTTWTFWSGARSGRHTPITDVWIPYKNDWFGGMTVFWSGCVPLWDLATNRQYPGRVYKSTANGASPVRLDTDGSAVLDNDPVTAPTRLIGPYNGVDYVYSISCINDMLTSWGWDPSIFKWESGVGWTTFGAVSTDPGDDSPAGWFRVTAPDVGGVQLPTHVGWHTEPYETSAGGDDDKGNMTALWLLPLEY